MARQGLGNPRLWRRDAAETSRKHASRPGPARAPGRTAAFAPRRPGCFAPMSQDAWNLVLAGVAAATGLASVGFWLYEQGKRRRERPTVALHVEVEPRWGNPPPKRDRVELTLTITSVGDATPRHLEVEGDGGFPVSYTHLRAHETDS